MNPNTKATIIFEASHPNNSDERLNLGAEVSWKNILTYAAATSFFMMKKV